METGWTSFAGLHWVSDIIDLVDVCIIEDLQFKVYFTSPRFFYVYLDRDVILCEELESPVMEMTEATFGSLLEKL